ncbi:MAG: hypothetical protein ACOCV1_05890 [Bacillota bacterium]
MRIYINDNHINDGKYSQMRLSKIFETVKQDLEDEIVKKIFLNDVEINEYYLKENVVDKKDIKELKFITQETNKLIIETLKEIDNYLPKLKKGVLNASEFLRIGKYKEANKKYQLIIDGLEWYIKNTNYIGRLINNHSLSKRIRDNVLSLNEILVEMMEAYTSNDKVLVADILEYEIIEYINGFQKLNKDIMEHVR